MTTYRITTDEFIMRIYAQCPNWREILRLPPSAKSPANIKPTGDRNIYFIDSTLGPNP